MAGRPRAFRPPIIMMKTGKRIAIALAALLFGALMLLFGVAPRTENPVPDAEPAVSAPALSETEAPSPETTPSPSPAPGPDYSGQLRISEVMVKNKAVLCVDGAFPDWIELENIAGKPLALSGWRLSDQELGAGHGFSEETLAPGALLLIPCGEELGFSLSGEETLLLLAPDGSVQDRVSCAESDESDRSLVRSGDRSFSLSAWATPGFSNDAAGYDAFCESRRDESPLLIDEVMVSNEATPLYNGQGFDYVELRNASGEALSLAGYTLTDDTNEPEKWRFADSTLKPGERLLITCDEESPASDSNTGFSLGAVSERLYLFDPSGALADYVWLHDIPVEGSMGRLEGENGFFYFTKVTPRAANAEGFRRVSARPETLTAEGIYNDVDSLTVSLSSPGEIRYTVDGSAPGLSSPLYEGPLTLEKTAVVRAIAVEEGAAPSRPVSFSYLLNEGHTLPVLSLTVDDRPMFNRMFLSGNKVRRTGANLALYTEEGCEFSQACELRIAGWTSLKLDKKSMAVDFKGRYGGDLRCDVFGNGIDRYSSLAIRAGQDYLYTIFRNELFQDLAAEASDAVLTQANRWCVLYIDGEYYGLYCLKEDLAKQFYASHAGVSKESVRSYKTPAAPGTPFFDEILAYAQQHDLTQPEHYQYMCEHLDMDSLIDWMLFESYSCNSDVQGNLRVFSSPENGGKWSFALYDLDWAFYYKGCAFYMVLNGDSNLPIVLHQLIRQPDFRDRCLHRYAELIAGPLSNENVLQKIDDYVALLEPEAPRDRERWHKTMKDWYDQLDILRAFITDNDWARLSIERFCTEAEISPAERAEYFGF